MTDISSNQTATRILDLTNQSVVNYIGDYDYYLEKKEELTDIYAPRSPGRSLQKYHWWLDRGLSGFRIDAIINIKKKLPYKDYASDRADGLCTVDNMLAEAQGVGEFLGEMRDRTFGPHEAFSVGEVFNEKDEELPDFYWG